MSQPEDKSTAPWSAQAGALLAQEVSRPDPSAEALAQVWAKLEEPVAVALKTATLATWVKGLSLVTILTTGGALVGATAAVMQHRELDRTNEYWNERLDALKVENAALKIEQPQRASLVECPTVECVPTIKEVLKEKEVFAASPLDSERQVLARAQMALTKGNTSATDSALAEYRRRFPQGRLREEHDALEVRALMQSGNEGLARDKARRFLSAYPDSLQRMAIAKLVGMEAR